ncbi:MAG: peroxiredoxin [Thiohalocapsa sp.]|jgi:peroxiredoxin Q/BCP|nr:peroxiredoxin [Thiohalocapsa sp.]
MRQQVGDMMLKLSEVWTRATGGRFSAMPAPGSAAPDFDAADQQGTRHRLGDYRGRWLVLYFYPRDETPGCTAEACSFRDNLAEVTGLGAAVIGVSTDEEAAHARFAADHGLSFPLLADTGGDVARAYGVLWDKGPRPFARPFARRRTFVIDPDGRIAKRYLRVPVGEHAEQVAADLRALAGAAAA